MIEQKLYSLKPSSRQPAAGFALVLVAALITGCQSTAPHRSTAACDYPSLPGEERVFRPLLPPPATYQHWYSPVRPDDGLDYRQYVNTGLKIPDPQSTPAPSALVAVTPACETLHIRSSLALTHETLPLIKLEQASHLQGRTVWLQPNHSAFGAGLPPDLLRDADPLEPLEVTAIDPAAYQPATGTSAQPEPLYLVVVRESGEQARIPWLPGTLLTENPIDASWPKSVQRAILARQIRRGMTGDQARLAWGEPKRRIQSRSGGASFERWVYPRGSIVFREGRVLSFQR